ncbi:Hpt domain-containing protein [Maridesulfovibrio ferrireducens]|uniref:Hpt domain-containing protein n=1 Tax=Maridesulfovibrio ferrireducens TaxID=246191 RepID=UPI001A1B76C7|nr:Hpt domain-containing protein [Maridesulfovibrio ferrireducens]MBI9111186.1 Hpt domain-containing protein [Maridesulfovibrio ferrireducens]
MNELEKKLAELNERYAADLGERVMKIEGFLSEYASSGSEDALENLYKGAHALAGSARTFGLPDVSVVAKELELSARDSNDVKFLQTKLTKLKRIISS